MAVAEKMVVRSARKAKGSGYLRRAEILEAAERIFIEEGYEGATIRKIAEEVGVSSTALYVHFRGKERLRFARQLGDHSTYLAPYNVLMYAGSAVPNQPVIPVASFPELSKLSENWETIRDEAVRLFDEGFIRAAAKNNDWGFYSFFKSGWKRFYLKWYDAPLPSATRIDGPAPHLLIVRAPYYKAVVDGLTAGAERILREAGASSEILDVAGSGQLGIDLARQHRPALILLDLHLPDLSGEVVLQRLRAEPETAAIPVYVLSADAHPGTVRRLVVSGAAGYLPKPLNLRDVLELVDRLTGQTPEPA